MRTLETTYEASMQLLGDTRLPLDVSLIFNSEQIFASLVSDLRGFESEKILITSAFLIPKTPRTWSIRKGPIDLPKQDLLAEPGQDFTNNWS
ncbi:hypothetical protein BpHYR1_012370 [Brachionus plicatilis]|uniref:Uncharacterized protein n=1 Tax=Brachionus plicatilis TaxID=10195 RepID=A0A3M7S1L7_BRAPC|nr:hypothetical protein BpHYR1_012370 [Brachionus plicatilis]